MSLTTAGLGVALLFTGPVSEVLGRTRLIHTSLIASDSINAPRTISGATWSPSSITYGGNNRTHMVRIPDGGRAEYRLPDGAANPYLLLAAILAAGMHGIEKQIDPGKRLDIDMYAEGHTVKNAKKLPLNLLDALRNFDGGRAAKFTTYAYGYVRGAMLKALAFCRTWSTPADTPNAVRWESLYGIATDDATDDDCDGYYDCGDPDCAAASACLAGGLCPAAAPIACGSKTPPTPSATPTPASSRSGATCCLPASATTWSTPKCAAKNSGRHSLPGFVFRHQVCRRGRAGRR